jgi:hypothetical protein
MKINNIIQPQRADGIRDSVRRIRFCDAATIPSTPREKYGCDDAVLVAQRNDALSRTETRLPKTTVAFLPRKITDTDLIANPAG